jgi:kynurenine formamidase
VENGGIVGRGVLLDYAGWAASKNMSLGPLTTWKITLAELKEVAEYQKISFRPNDILFIRSGYVKALLSLTEDEAMVYSKSVPPAAIGVESGEEMLRWIWENEFAAVAGDMTAFEAHPFQSKEYMLHEWLLGGWGMPIGELFDLEKLAEECRQLNKWSFFFTSIPLKVSLLACKEFAA